MKYALFLKWWLLVVLISIGAIAFWQSGLAEIVWEKDATKISFAIAAIFGLMTTWCGWKVWVWGRQDIYIEDEMVVKFERLEEVGNFVCGAFFQLGMLGTIIGLTIMFSSFDEMDLTTAEAKINLLQTIGLGASTAFYTTASGLICGMLLQLQYFILGQSIKTHKSLNKDI